MSLTKEALKNPTSIAHLVNSHYYLARRQHEEAALELERALALDPNNPASYAAMGHLLLLSGRPKESLDFINRAIRLDPLNPSRYLYLLGCAQFCMGNLEEAAALIERGLKINPDATRAGSWLIAIYGLLGKEEEARTALETFSKGRAPKPGIRNITYFFPFTDQALADRFAEGLIKGGVPGRASEYLPGFKENRLKGEEIKDLLFGSVITGFFGDTPGGKQWRIVGPDSLERELVVLISDFSDSVQKNSLSLLTLFLYRYSIPIHESFPHQTYKGCR